VVFCGRVVEEQGPSPRRFYLIDLAGPARGKPRLIADVDAGFEFVQLAVSPDDRFAFTVLPAGDLFHVVRLALDEDRPAVTLLTLTTRPFGLDLDRQGRLYLDQFQRGLEVLRFDPAGGPATRIASPLRGRKMQPVELPDGRVLLPSKAAGRNQLLAGLAGKEAAPLLDDRGETAPPALLIDDRRLALVAGSGEKRRLKVATLEDDQVRIHHALPLVPGDDLAGLAASPDGKTLYYVHARHIWAVPSDGRGQPHKVEPGDGVAVHPGSGDLLIQRFEKSGVRLYQRPSRGGAVKEVKVQAGPLRLAPEAVGGRAIDRGGRVLVTVAARDNWFWRVGLLDMASGKLSAIPVEFDGEIYPSNWARDGKVLGMGAPLKAELWRLTPGK
jgi:hypothetical protein